MIIDVWLSGSERTINRKTFHSVVKYKKGPQVLTLLLLIKDETKLNGHFGHSQTFLHSLT